MRPKVFEVRWTLFPAFQVHVKDPEQYIVIIILASLLVLIQIFLA